MTKKTYPAWHYYLAGALALLFGVGQLSMRSWIYGAIFTAVGIAVVAYGYAHRAPRPLASDPQA